MVFTGMILTILALVKIIINSFDHKDDGGIVDVKLARCASPFGVTLQFSELLL